ncbi:MAG: T9SS type A sorting domain-containing protein [Bacteroidota bacterium]
MLSRVSALLLFVGLAGVVHAQAVRIADIQPGSQGSLPQDFEVYAGALYFSANGPGVGTELHRYTEADGVTLAADVLPGGLGSFPTNLVVFNGALYFSADVPETGRELYRFTETGGAVRVTDIRPGADDGLIVGPRPEDPAIYDGALFIRAVGTDTGRELYRYTEATGAQLVADLWPGPTSSAPNLGPEARFAVFGGALYLAANDGATGTELYRYTTASGLVRATDVPGSLNPSWLTAYDGGLYFQGLVDGSNTTVGAELVQYNGVALGLAANVNTRSSPVIPSNDRSSSPAHLAVAEGVLYFAADDGLSGEELWQYTSAGGAGQAADVRPGASGSLIDFTTSFAGGLYFRANAGTAAGNELYRYVPGTSVELAADIPSSSQGSFPADLAVYEGALYFRADGSPGGTEPYRFALPSVVVSDEAGYRILAAPGEAETVGSFLGPLVTSGFPGSDVPTQPPSVFFYDETLDGNAGIGYTPPVSSEAAINPGTGLYAFVTAGGGTRLPLLGDEPSLPFRFEVTYFNNVDGGTDEGDDVADDGWNLLGNPIRDGLLWDAVWHDPVTADVSSVVHVYDLTLPGFRTFDASTDVGDLPGGEIPMGAGMWVKATGVSSALEAPVTSRAPAASRANPAPHLALELSAIGSQGQSLGSHTFAVVGGTDAPAMRPLADEFVLLGSRDDEGRLFAHAALPTLAEGTEPFTVPLRISATTASADAVLRWTDALASADWRVLLRDAETSNEVDLSAATEYVFALTEGASDRFSLAFAPRSTVDAEPEAEGAFTVSAPWPNPTAGAVRLAVTLPRAEAVRAEVFDALGRRVASLHDGALVAGRHVLALPAGVLGAGVHSVRVAAGDRTEIRRLVVTR